MSAASGKAAPRDLAQIASQVCELARRRGAQQAAAEVTENREVDLIWRDGKIEKISEATTRGLQLSLFVDGRFAVADTSDLRPEALPGFIDRNITLARVLAKDPARALPDPSLYPTGALPDLDVYDAAIDKVAPEDRRDLARALEAAARAQPGAAAIVSVTSNVGDVRTERVRVASNGFQGRALSTEFYGGADVSVKDEGGKRPEAGDFAVVRHRGEFPAAQQIGAEAARRALSRIGAKPGASAALPMVLENRVAGRLLSFLIQPLSGAALQQKRSFLDGLQGQGVGSARLTLTDDPLLPRALGSRPFDPEGMAARKLPLFVSGVLSSFYVDTYYARKLKRDPTTGRPSNIIVQPGDRSLDALLRDAKEGILVSEFIGGNSNATTGDFSLGVRGHRVRGGHRAEAVTEMNIAGNHKDLWRRLVAVGDDPYRYGTIRTPTLLFDQVQFAGA